MNTTLPTFDHPAYRLPKPPIAETPEEERLRRKRELAAAFRLFGRFGFGEGVGGHVTARDPLRPNCFWVNPFGVPFEHIRVSDLLLVEETGMLVEGEGLVNLAGFYIHSRVHAARPDVQAVAHAHSLYGKTFSSFGRPLDPITQDSLAFYEDHSVYDGFGGLVFDPEEGDRIAKALGPHKAVILRNHGLLTVGRTVAETAWWFISMERSCQAQLIAMAAGEPTLIDEEEARQVAGVTGTADFGWFNFQPLHRKILALEPDHLD
ncbi:ribulose-5-phosphate 4-epimerase/fuculose-1-phosphate aldolase [Thermocatellispora tengchongensis]|uniref:Ribulose-5-phosphate 4-epimerase/fuculose-1-phosphate aldolase n=1 Tax=Thermocatellispora tengchongensis TaxID=1073253 RepID=A0A840PF86_9ACTN|nr:class II aldolase/adducin family protein [Thermocatellispora tengchongensis]MBB5137832.1 ribulose-5-phosphate 4-epimerase/fuculose-1-phosphate aldolase [Thermocatellispora tengchongensis]